MKFQMPTLNDQQTLVWPPEPHEPRFAYVGDIIGESNLVESSSKQRSNAFAHLMQLVIGLGGDEETPMVLQRPQNGVVTQDRRIYVTDVSRHAVYMFDETQGLMEIWQHAEPGVHFITPTGITADLAGNIYVVDADQHCVYILNRKGKSIGQFGCDVLQRPNGIAYNVEKDWFYVADTRARDIKIFDRNGRLLDLIGSEGNEPGYFNAPTYLAFHNGRLYVSDTLNARIQVLDAEGEPLHSIGRRGLYKGQFTRPKGVALDSDSNIYAIESYYDHMIIFNQQGELLLTIGGAGYDAGEFFLPAGIWSDNRDRIYVADMMNGRVAVFQYLGNTP